MHRIKARSNRTRLFLGTESQRPVLTTFSKLKACQRQAGKRLAIHRIIKSTTQFVSTTPTSVRQRVAPKRILLAEDEPSVAISLLRVLALDGHAVELAEDGRKALGMFDPAKHDLVITDFKMDHMDGLELAEAIKARSPGTPIILLTAYLELLKSTDGNVSNVDLLLGKPCSIVELHGAMQRVFAAP